MVIALVTDLLFSSKIRRQAALTQQVLRVCRTHSEFEAALKDSPEKIIVDLNSRRVVPEFALQLCKSHGLIEKVVAFCSHVDRDLHQMAEDAGVRHLYARSQFVREIPKLMGN